MRLGSYQLYLWRTAWLVLAACTAGCATWRLPEKAGPPLQSYALPAAEDGFLDEYGDRIESQLVDGESAYWLLDRGDLALNARMAVTDMAVSTLDIQYFIWDPDETGRLLAQRVIRAADRGVRVRLLLDDILLTRRDGEIAGLDFHPNIEVRVFNPWEGRNGSVVSKVFEFLARPSKLTHRMHNKTYVADNRFAIVGGRNIGNRYFGLHQAFVQNDLDVMMAGPLVSDVSSSFDDFWNSDAVYTGDYFANGQDPETLYAELNLLIDTVVEEQSELLQSFISGADAWHSQFEYFVETMEPGTGKIHYDSPNIHDTRPIQLDQRLDNFIESAQREILISSPYFIPDEQFCEDVRWLTSRGVRVAVITNSLASNNHPIAHTGYKNWRRAIIEAGAELYEMRMDAEALDYYRTAPVNPDRLGLHTKAIVVDGYQVYIGSANLDRRSLLLNTELGIIAEGVGLASRLSNLILRDMTPENSWRLTLSDRNSLVWTNSDEVVRRQPATGFKQRSAEVVLDILPLEGFL